MDILYIHTCGRAHTHTHTHFLIIMVRMIAPDLFSSKHSLPLEMAWLTILKIPTKSCFSYLSEWSFSKDYGRSGAVGRRGGGGGDILMQHALTYKYSFSGIFDFFSLFEIVSAGGNWCNEWIVCTKTCKDILHDVGIQQAHNSGTRCVQSVCHLVAGAIATRPVSLDRLT